VNTDDVALPEELVVAVVVVDPFANVPLAPLVGAVNITFTLLSRLPAKSFTVACSVDPNAVLIAAVCGVPPVAVTVCGGPGRLVREKLAVRAPVVAVTV